MAAPGPSPRVVEVATARLFIGVVVERELMISPFETDASLRAAYARHITFMVNSRFVTPLMQVNRKRGRRGSNKHDSR